MRETRGGYYRLAEDQDLGTDTVQHLLLDHVTDFGNRDVNCESATLPAPRLESPIRSSDVYRPM